MPKHLFLVLFYLVLGNIQHFPFLLLPSWLPVILALSSPLPSLLSQAFHSVLLSFFLCIFHPLSYTPVCPIDVVSSLSKIISQCKYRCEILSFLGFLLQASGP